MEPCAARAHLPARLFQPGYTMSDPASDASAGGSDGSAAAVAGEPSGGAGAQSAASTLTPLCDVDSGGEQSSLGSTSRSGAVTPTAQGPAPTPPLTPVAPVPQRSPPLGGSVGFGPGGTGAKRAGIAIGAHKRKSGAPAQTVTPGPSTAASAAGSTSQVHRRRVTIGICAMDKKVGSAVAACR